MNAAVIGAGTMGIGIAHAFATTGSSVILVESNDDARANAAARIGTVIDQGVQRGKLTEEVAQASKGNLQVVAALESLPDGLDIVVEAIPEIFDAKVAVLRAADARSPKVLASNTSSMSIDRLAGGVDHPERLIGMHFFNPVWSMALVELVVGSATSPDVVASTQACAAGLGKEYITVKNSPGFATSRLGIVAGLEAIRMVEEGVATPEDIDKGIVLGYGHPMGPLRLGDLVGLDVRLDIARYLAEALGDRFTPPALLEKMVAEGKLGKKSGQGFYTW